MLDALQQRRPALGVARVRELAEAVPHDALRRDDGEQYRRERLGLLQARAQRPACMVAVLFVIYVNWTLFVTSLGIHSINRNE